jgi:hypothetical protein
VIWQAWRRGGLGTTKNIVHCHAAIIRLTQRRIASF